MKIKTNRLKLLCLKILSNRKISNAKIDNKKVLIFLNVKNKESSYQKITKICNILMSHFYLIQEKLFVEFNRNEFKHVFAQSTNYMNFHHVINGRFTLITCMQQPQH